MNENKDKAIDFDKKLKEKLGRDLKQEIDNGEYDKLIDYILKAYNEGLNVFYKDKFAKTNDKNLSSIIGILDSQRETITNLNKKIQNQEKRIAKLEKEIELIKKK